MTGLMTEATMAQSAERSGRASVLAALIASLIVAVPAAGTALAADGVPAAQWLPAARLNVERRGHTATLLRDGTVLVAGGAADGSATAEIYDPAANRWTLTASMRAARTNPAAVLLRDGRLLVVGGTEMSTPRAHGSATLASAELYDPRTGTWTASASMNIGRSGATASLLDDGRVLVAGGWSSDRGEPVGRSELYDPATGTWSLAVEMWDAIIDYAAVRSRDGKVFAFGGWNGDDIGPTYDMDIEQFDPATGWWTYVGNVLDSRVYSCAALLPSGKILIAGGYKNSYPNGVTFPRSLQSAEVFDPVTRTTSRVGSLNIARQSASATPLPDGSVLVAGGLLWHSTANYATNYVTEVATAEVYDPATATWRMSADLIEPRHDHTATLLRDGRVLVAGGFSNGQPVASAELFELAPPGTITAGFTGSWYDPAQSGHGLHVQVLPDNKFLAAWFTFNPEGTQQAWFLGVGEYVGNTATVTSVVQPTGGRFIPNFDPARVVNNPWGTLKFTFTDCYHGRVDFDSIRGYGSGSMNLTRLTEPVGTNCGGTGVWDY